MAALSFCTTERSSAIVLEARTLRINCLTAKSVSGADRGLLKVPTGAHDYFDWPDRRALGRSM